MTLPAPWGLKSTFERLELAGLGQRLWFERVEARGEEVTGLQRGDEGLLVDRSPRAAFTTTATGCKLAIVSELTM